MNINCLLNRSWSAAGVWWMLCFRLQGTALTAQAADAPLRVLVDSGGSEVVSRLQGTVQAPDAPLRVLVDSGGSEVVSRLQGTALTAQAADAPLRVLVDSRRISGGSEVVSRPQGTALTAQAADAPLRVLVDSRCISGGSEVVSRLRLRHGLQVHVCSLISSDFIVSNRMAVERQSESELAGVQNRRRLQDRMQRLQGAFERVCVIIERDRAKPGENQHKHLKHEITSSL